MGVGVRIGDVAEWRATAWEYTEDATPVDPSDSFGGAGDFSFVVPVGVDPKLIVGLPVVASDGVVEVHGLILAVDLTNGLFTATCSTRLLPLVCDRNSLPHEGTVSTYLAYVFGLCGVTDDLVFDPAVADVEVVALGWSGNVWRKVRDFCAAYGVEVAVVGTSIMVRPMRGERGSRANESAFRWSMDRTGLAQTVTSWYYPITPVTGALLVGNEFSAVSYLGAGEVRETTIQLDYSLTSVQQPVPVGSVAYGYSGWSVYSVVDRFGKTVKPSYWLKQGGSVSVSIGDDSRSITVKVTGCLDHTLAPYRLVGLRDLHGQQVEYSTLRVVGSGLAFERRFYTMHACTDGSATVEVGCEVDNDFITSFGQCHRLLLWAAVRYGSPTVRVNGSAELGAGAGARLLDDSAEYRVRSVTRGPTGLVSYEAEWDTVIDDVDTVWGASTLDEFSAAHTTINAFNVRPLTT